MARRASSFQSRRAIFRASSQTRHADDWLMTYADMITLLLCFFVVFAIARHQPEKTPVPVVASVKVMDETSKTEKQPEEKEQPKDIKTVLAQPLPALQTVPPSSEPYPPLSFEGQTTSVPSPSTPSALDADQTEDARGARILSFEISSAAIFDSGSAVINPGGEPALTAIANKLTNAVYDDYLITVEGHTDDSPVSTAQFPSNWELSTARAAAVVRYLIGQGLKPERLRVAGYADTYPKLPNRDANGKPIPANQAQNRRVVVRLEKIVNPNGN